MTPLVLALVAAGCGQAAGGSSGAAVAVATPSPTASATPTPSADPTPSDPPACSRTTVGSCEPLYDLSAPASCPLTVGVFIHPPRQAGTKFPNSGLGHGPVYFTGQTRWYSGSQEGLFLVDSAYTGPVTVAAQLNGATASPTFGGSRQLQIAAGSAGSSWRSWAGQVSFADPGCYTLTMSGSGFADQVVIYVHGGPPPPA